MGSPNSLVAVESADGARFDLRSFTCKRPRAAIVIVPAMGVPAKFYDHFGEELVASEFSVFVSELRGIGSSSLRASRANDFGYRELVELDLVAALNAVKTRAPELPLFVLGHSLGGHVALLFAGMHASSISGVIVVAGGSPYFRNWKLPMSAVTLLAAVVMRSVGVVLGYVPGNRIGFGGREANRLVAEWGRFVRTGKLVVRGIDEREMDRDLASSKIPLLGISLEEDHFAPRASVDRLLAMLPNANLTRIHLSRGAVGENIDHFRWAKNPAVVARLVRKWVDELK